MNGNAPESNLAQLVEAPAPPEPVTIGELLQDVPLHSSRSIEAGRAFMDGRMPFPSEIRVHCDHDDCQGTRRHTHQETATFSSGRGDTVLYALVSYRCANCLTTFKVFGVKLESIKGGVQCTKIYQEPPFGHPIPKRLFEIIGEENRNHFLQARRAIARGLGIGSYAYYRRIVENNKFDLVGSVLAVAKGTNAPVSQVELLERAQRETQFSKAIEILVDVSSIPPVLLIDGHNPLLLLHNLLSKGLHELTDDECLSRARDAEVILCEIAERMQLALTERKAVKTALSNIMQRKPSDGAGATQ